MQEPTLAAFAVEVHQLRCELAHLCRVIRPGKVTTTARGAVVSWTSLFHAYLETVSKTLSPETRLKETAAPSPMGKLEDRPATLSELFLAKFQSRGAQDISAQGAQTYLRRKFMAVEVEPILVPKRHRSSTNACSPSVHTLHLAPVTSGTTLGLDSV